jgi:hypothetical protein
MTSHNEHEKEKMMTNDYLWDGSGTPDPQIQRFESLLTEFRYSDRPLVLPADTSATPNRFRGLLIQIPWLPRLAAAAVLIFALAASVFFSLIPAHSPATPGSLDVTCLQGELQVGTTYITADHANTKLQVGQTLETNSTSRASISEKFLGQIDVEPGSRVRLVQSDNHRKRIQLDRGTIHAAIWAPPGQFVVDTPSAIAVDLGCAYTLQVSPDGSGTIRTTLGWVGFHLNGRDSFIPAGAICSTRPNVGPGTPYFEDASESFRDALRLFDLPAQSSDSRSAALATILAQARARDGLTLWHLLSRTSGPERAQVYARFATLVPPPRGVSREGILNLDQSMLDLYWNSLNLGDIFIWRFWEQSPEALPGK